MARPARIPLRCLEQFASWQATSTAISPPASARAGPEPCSPRALWSAREHYGRLRKPPEELRRKLGAFNSAAGNTLGHRLNAEYPRLPRSMLPPSTLAFPARLLIIPWRSRYSPALPWFLAAEDIVSGSCLSASRT